VTFVSVGKSGVGASRNWRDAAQFPESKDKPLDQLDHFWEKEQTKADVEVFILDEVYANLPTPPFTAEEKKLLAGNVYTHVWQQAIRGEFAKAA
jgi:hypothetical protein